MLWPPEKAATSNVGCCHRPGFWQPAQNLTVIHKGTELGAMPIPGGTARSR